VPKEVDTDGDGIPDSKDKCPTVYAKTADGCPVAEPVAEPAPAPVPAPAPAVAPVPKKLELEGVNFDHDKATLREDAHPILDQAAEGLKEWGNVNIEVAGYTDSRGKDKYNLKLSQRRAEAVRAYLITKGIAADRLTAKGFGETNPVADNKTAEGRFKNRRVELIEQK
jgi:OOP family OmpA-OmpF porin